MPRAETWRGKAAIELEQEGREERVDQSCVLPDFSDLPVQLSEMIADYGCD